MNINPEHPAVDKAYTVAQQLLSLVREFSVAEVEATVDPEGIRSEHSFDLGQAVVTPDQGHVRSLIGALDRTLTEAGWKDDLVSTVGRLGIRTGGFRLRLAPRPVHHGYLQPVIEIPLVEPAPDNVVAFLIKLPDASDLLERENHSFLWHYHYLNSKEERSDVVLCWDTRATVTPQNPRPLFHEKHGEGKKAFSARPDLWGDHKRETMYVAVHPDLRRWKIGEFRCASNKSQPVWPLTACLTPPPTKAPTPRKHPARSKKGRR